MISALISMSSASSILRPFSDARPRALNSARLFLLAMR